jgi:hypothetical protein
MALAASYKMKPPVSARLAPGHPLAHGLVGVWLFNEGSGSKVFDLSGNQNIGAFEGDTHFIPGKFGPALHFDGTGDYVDCGNDASLEPNQFTLCFWVKGIYSGGSKGLISRGTSGSATNNHYYIFFNGGKIYFYIGDGVANNGDDFSTTLIDNTWYHIVAVLNSSKLLVYVNGVKDVTEVTRTIDPGITAKTVIGALSQGSQYYFNGAIDHVVIWNRALTAIEITQLYREPFCMFDPVLSVSVLFATTGQVLSLAGTVDVVSSVDGSLSVTGTLGGTLAAVSSVGGSLNVVAEVTLAGTADGVAILCGSLSVTGEVTLAGAVHVVAALYGSLGVTAEVTLAGTVDTVAALCGILSLYRPGPWFSSLLAIEKKWLIEALFGGVTANAFKLGTVLSLGWFWVRRSGCSALYRGPSMPQIDFANVLAVAAQGAASISPPVYVAHDGGSTYFYVVRRFNNCGHQEHTLAGAVKLVLDAQGDIAQPTPNGIFALRAEQVDAIKVRLVWYYCPLEQESAPVRFNVYCDSGMGQIDYENPMAVVGYEGRKFYNYESSAVGAGRYLFAIRAEDAGGIQNNSLAQVGIQLSATSPDAISILGAKGV